MISLRDIRKTLFFGGRVDAPPLQKFRECVGVGGAARPTISNMLSLSFRTAIDFHPRRAYNRHRSH